MAKSDVVFKLDAETGKAVSAYLKLIEAQKKTESQYKQTTGSAKKQDATFSKTAGSVAKLAGGFLGAAGLAAGVRSFGTEIQKSIEDLIKFETKISGLLNLGDNIKNAKAIKSDVLNISSATGFATGDIIRSRFDIGSGGATLTPELRKRIEQEAIEFGLAEGADPSTFSKALLTGIKVSGQEFNNDPNLLQNIFFKTVEAGRLTNQELADRVGQILGPFTDAGFTAKEALSLVPSATALGLPTEQVFTVLRNLPGILKTELKKKFDIDITGKTLNEALNVVATELTQEQRANLFGRENLTIGSQVVKERGQQKIDLASLTKISPKSDFVRDKFQTRLLTDQSFEAARLFKTAGVSGENLRLQKGLAESSVARNFALNKRGAQDILPAGLDGDVASTILGIFGVFTDFVRKNRDLVPGGLLLDDLTGGNTGSLRERGVTALAAEKLGNPITKLEGQQLLVREFGGEGALEKFQEAQIEKIKANNAALDAFTEKLNAAGDAVVLNPNAHTE